MSDGSEQIVRLSQKDAGAYYTPATVSQSLLSWALRSHSDRMLDPSCGDGQFISGHINSVGIEQDQVAARKAMERAPWALVHEGDFFTWAASTAERFDCAAGNPPFIRYQTFKGEVRDRALRLCASAGAAFNGLASSWAPFLVATATLLRRGGRMAFVVPAEIGHAPYAAPLLEYLVAHFAVVHIVAVRSKLFPDLSEDCWLLYAEGFGEETFEVRFTAIGAFSPMAQPPSSYTRIPIAEWRTTWGKRLRPYLMSTEARSLYRDVVAAGDTRRFEDLASIGIGYVTGANDFFHLRPSQARHLRIPKEYLQPAVRNGRVLPAQRLTASTLQKWQRDDERFLLLRMPKQGKVPAVVQRYLDTEEGQLARQAFKCRTRDPWYSVPDVQIPDFFLSYMSGLEAGLVRNDAKCSCTNSVHSVRVKPGQDVSGLLEVWRAPFVKLSTELEGHPLGGGMLKLEPKEAAKVVLPSLEMLERLNKEVLNDALSTLREWRHYAVAG